MSAVLIKLKRHARHTKNSREWPRGRQEPHIVFHPTAAAIDTQHLMAISQHVNLGKSYLLGTGFVGNVIIVCVIFRPQQIQEKDGSFLVATSYTKANKTAQ